MQRKSLYAIWGVLYVICAGLGFVENPEGFLAAFMTGLSVAFFIPGILLLVDGVRSKDRHALEAMTWISGASLGATCVLLLLNFLAVGGTAATGNFLYGLLILVSSPMICSRVWVLSLFLWACLFAGSIMERKKIKK